MAILFAITRRALVIPKIIPVLEAGAKFLQI
jgi:hypothetical protein